MSLLTPNYPAVDKITIIPRGEALGYVSSIMEEKFLYSTSKQDLLNRIDVALAGRVAEEVMLGWAWSAALTRSKDNVSTGASNDLEKATQYVLSMAYQWGMTPVRAGWRSES